MLATLTSAALQGIESDLVHVEVNTNESGDPDLIVVGLPDTSVRESCRRVSSAVVNSGFKMPWSRTTINLAPGHIRKEGPCYDLPIALGMLMVSGALPTDTVQDYLVAGELGLSGATRPVRGALAMGRLARALGRRGVILPVESAREAALVSDIDVIAVESLDQAVRFLRGEVDIPPLRASQLACQATSNSKESIGDFAEIKGQQTLRRAVEVAVAGNHNLLVIGPPGSGKSMVAKRIPTIMPAPTLQESLEILSIHSAAGQTLGGPGLEFGRRPVRAPHHTVSDVALLGGGSIPGPGEISLAHHGVLFLDELPEFRRSVLEVLRQPLEDGTVTISRSAGKITLPCGFMLVAAMNPCPCGYLGDAKHQCRCSPTQIERYRGKISGPLLDRIDLHVEAPALSLSELRSEAQGESSAAIRIRTEEARTRQRSRFAGSRTTANARMTHAQIRAHCRIDAALGDMLQQAMERLKLSARAYDRILKVARTIADLAGSEAIETTHLFEAIQYRSLDRNLFQ